MKEKCSTIVEKSVEKSHDTIGRNALGKMNTSIPSPILPNGVCKRSMGTWTQSDIHVAKWILKHFTSADNTSVVGSNNDHWSLQSLARSQCDASGMHIDLDPVFAEPRTARPGYISEKSSVSNIFASPKAEHVGTPLFTSGLDSNSYKPCFSSDAVGSPLQEMSTNIFPYQRYTSIDRSYLSPVPNRPAKNYSVSAPQPFSSSLKRYLASSSPDICHQPIKKPRFHCFGDPLTRSPATDSRRITYQMPYVNTPMRENLPSYVTPVRRNQLNTLTRNEMEYSEFSALSPALKKIFAPLR